MPFAIALLAPPPIERAPRLRRLLPNGAVVLSEYRPGETRVRIEAILTNPGLDSVTDYGRRHLLEHLVAARDPGLDRALEAVGGSFGASTGRDLMRFWIEAPAASSDLAFGTISALLRPLSLREEAVAREVRIIGREVALLSRPERASITVWNALYGEAGRDALGTATALENAPAGELSRLWSQMLVGRRIALGVSGPEDVDRMNDRLREIAIRFVPGKPPTDSRGWTPRQAVAPSAVQEGAFALAVGSVVEPRTLAALGAALALAGEVEGTSVIYTPSPRGGVILLENAPASAELARTLRRSRAGTVERALPLLNQWLAVRTFDPAASLTFRTTLYGFAPTLTPERIAEAANTVGAAQIQTAFAEWAKLAP